jgi:hypothetical protein
VEKENPAKRGTRGGVLPALSKGILGHQDNASRQPRVPLISTRSHCRPNSDTEVCEARDAGGFPPLLARSQPRLAHEWRGFFRGLHSRRQLFANVAIAASRVAA